MKNFCHGASSLCLVAALHLSAVVSNAAQSRELIRDNHFNQGFVLWEPKPGKHVRYGALNGSEADTKPVWGLLQWSSKFPLDAATAIMRADFLVCSNAAKGIGKTKAVDLSMSANSRVEYGSHARKRNDPWVHLLVEQEFEEPARLSDLKSASLHVETRLIQSRNLHEADYSPDLHAAQFQIFFTVQNRNRNSAGYGDLVWFGVPIYDNRERFPKAFKAQDFGGTGKFIFTADGKAFTRQSAHDGEWGLIEKDLLPLMTEALNTAWASGFLKHSKLLSDYYISGMNMGWELPGTFDVEMQVRGLSLNVSQKLQN